MNTSARSGWISLSARTRKFRQSRPVYLSPGFLFTNTARWLRHYQIYGPSSPAQHSSTSRSCCALEWLLLRDLRALIELRDHVDGDKGLSQSRLASLLCHLPRPACVCVVVGEESGHYNTPCHCSR